MNVTGVWLRSIGSDLGMNLEVLVEIDGKWRLVIEELADGNISHIVEEAGMANAPADTITA
jgi:hypothetical protein